MPKKKVIRIEIKVPSGATLVSSPFLDVDFKFSPTLEQRLNNFYGLYGPLQKFADNEFMNGIKPYMPFKTGAMQDNMRQFTVLGSGVNYTPGPYARYLYYGMLYVDPVYKVGAFFSEGFGFWSRPGISKIKTNIELKFHDADFYGGGSKRGAKWDIRWKADNLTAYVKSLQNFVDRGGH